MLIFPGKYGKRIEEHDAHDPRKKRNPGSGRFLVSYKRAGTVDVVIYNRVQHKFVNKKVPTCLFP